MATQLQSPPPELVPQENEQRTATPVDDPIEFAAPAAKAFSGGRYQALSQNSVRCRAHCSSRRRHSGLDLSLLL